jgi:hypothetical protein
MNQTGQGRVVGSTLDPTYPKPVILRKIEYIKMDGGRIRFFPG